MNIIIPLGGKGERFSRTGYSTPKPLIRIRGKPMISYVLDNLHLHEDDRIFIIYNQSLDAYNFTSVINKPNMQINFIKVNDTKGAAETLYLGITDILQKFSTIVHDKTLVLDCDTFYTQNIVDMYRQTAENAVFYTHNIEPAPIYSYIEIDDNKKITRIQEKCKISDNANTGAYAFSNIWNLHTFCKFVVENNIEFCGEPYTSCVIGEMIKSNHTFVGIELRQDRVFSLGTPDAVNHYLETTKSFLFDMDGTMVLTDDIYMHVWQKIYRNYGIEITPQIYDSEIRGNTDKYIVRNYLSTHNVNHTELSENKDLLFIEHLSEIVVVDGLYEFINKLRETGHAICVVTNSNRLVANAILRHIGLYDIMHFIITSDDCVNGKPNKEPYEKCIHLLNIPVSQCIIFEDSKAGILSAKMVNPGLLVGMETKFSHTELINLGVNVSIPDFMNADFLLNTSSVLLHATNQIETTLTTAFPNNKIAIHEMKLKGGFISDVVGFQMDERELVYKYENEGDTMLSTMAKQLDLYNREYYFYTAIAPTLDIPKPGFIAVVDKGIVLENFYAKGFVANLDLNKEPIDTTLKIIDMMGYLHTKYRGSCETLKQRFSLLKTTMDPIFYPFLPNFVEERREPFMRKWANDSNREIFEHMFSIFPFVQKRFAESDDLCFIHGDIKSPNIFYDTANDNTPYLIDWQHCGIGKGTQDLVFFMIESFTPEFLCKHYERIILYYYEKYVPNGKSYMEYLDYKKDLIDSICYIPFFTAVWFGTVPEEELIDADFPVTFIRNMLNCYNLL